MADPSFPNVCALDLDGTLVDTVPDMAYCLDEALSRVGFDRVGEEKVRTWVGDGLSELIRNALDSLGVCGSASSLGAEVESLFLELYAVHTCERSRVYPGVLCGLNRLRTRGVRLACVTNKRSLYTAKVLEQTGLAGWFTQVVSGDTLANRKPHPAPLLHVAATLGAEPATCLLVGDSGNDVKAARAAGFAIICVSYGYNRGLDIRLERPDAVMDSMAELDTILQGSEFESR